MPDIVRIQTGGLPGVELASGAIGEPANQGRMLGSAAVEGLEIVQSFTGGPWVPEAGWCREHKADGSACRAKPIKGTDLCVGHKRKIDAATKG